MRSSLPDQGYSLTRGASPQTACDANRLAPYLEVPPRFGHVDRAARPPAAAARTDAFGRPRPPKGLARCSAWLGHTNKNRFLLLDLRGEPELPDAVMARLAELACATPLVDDVLVVQLSHVADARFRVFGGDGREATFCGNGALFTLSLLGSRRRGVPLLLESGGRLRTGLVEADGRCRVDVGRVRPMAGMVSAEAFEALGELGARVLGALEAGEPHLVLAAPPAMPGDEAHRRHFARVLQELGALAPLPGGINVTLVVQRRPGGLVVCTFERGVRRLTASCGSGAVAAAAACFADVPGDHAFTIESSGGAHRVSRDGDHWWLAAYPQALGHATLDEILDLGMLPAQERQAAVSPRSALAAPFQAHC